jgi:hypothetical protein
LLSPQNRCGNLLLPMLEMSRLGKDGLPVSPELAAARNQPG